MAPCIAGGALLVFAALAACGNPRPEPAIQPSARVRVKAAALGDGWHTAEVGQVGECLVVLVAEPPEAPVRLIPLTFDQVAELRVSTLYDARPDAGHSRRYAAGADTTGEGWSAVDLQRLRRRYGGCLP